MIGLYYLGGKTMREIGDTLGINESRVSQIHKAALDKMRVNLQAAGIHSSDVFYRRSEASLLRRDHRVDGRLRNRMIQRPRCS